MSRWVDSRTPTQPIPILTPDEAHEIERGLTDYYAATGTERPVRIIPQPRPWPQTTAPGTGRRRDVNPLAFGRALSEPSIVERYLTWCDRHSLVLLVIVTALCVAAVLVWGGL